MDTRRILLNWPAFLLLSLFLIPVSGQAANLEKVSLQLDWKFQFEYAGFIMAREKGYYADVGLDVELREYSKGIDIIQDVLSEKINYGIHNSSVVIQDGVLEPIILMATYYQQSPLVFVTSKDIKSPRDLMGKRVMGTEDELKYSSLALLLNHFYVNRKNTSFVDHNFGIDDFINGRVDAMTAFRTNQIFELDRLGVEYNIIDPADFGFFMSAVNLFTSRAEALNYTDRTRSFIEASNKGWRYALDNAEETINVIYEKYSQEKSKEALMFEADVTRKMMLLDFFDVGATNKDLSLRSVSQFQFSGLLNEEQELESFLFEEVVWAFEREVHFSQDQKQYMQDKKVLTYCVDPEWMPFESINDGEHIGIAADVFELFRQQLPIPINLLETASWQESLDKTKTGECDLLSLASSSPERLKYMDFTSSYINLPLVMATTMDKIFIADIDEVKDKKLGVVKGYAIAEKLGKSDLGFNLVEVDSISDGLMRVESGELYGYIDNLMVIANAIQLEFTGVLKVSARLEGEVRLAVGTRNDEPLLHEVFEAMVLNLSEKDTQPIYNRWVPVKQDTAFNYDLLWKLLVFILLLSVAYLYHYIKLKKLNKKLLKLSVTDNLTGLFNRGKMDQVLMEFQSSKDRYDANTSIILLDVDLFKNINDTYGHPTGDSVLIKISQLLKDNIRQSDYAGRWGGEEFLIVCPNIDQQEAYSLAEKLRNKIRDHDFHIADAVTVSAGVTELSQKIHAEKTISNADTALYRSKQQGRDQCSIYEPQATG